MGDYEDENNDDSWLWKEISKDIKPIDRQKPISQTSEAPKKVPKKQQVQESPESKIPAKSAEPAPTTTESDPNLGLDRRTDERLRRGQMPIEATLDLHGYRLHEAHQAFMRFIQMAHGSGKRCVLVITGKGMLKGVGADTGQNDDAIWSEPKRGVIRDSFKSWLEEPAVKHLVLRTYKAQPKHGGGGAFYVLLRRKRDR